MAAGVARLNFTDQSRQFTALVQALYIFERVGPITQNDLV